MPMVIKRIPVAFPVVGTHTNFPVLINPTAMTGWGTITLAEAQSIRFYSDEARTTEIPREVVSATEIWVRVSSLTSTAVIWCDYDGIRADYAVGATFGRNAVWSGFGSSARLNDVVDSTGGFSWNNIGGMTFEGGLFGNGVRHTGVNGRALHSPTSLGYSYSTAQPFTWSFWLRHNVAESDYILDVLPVGGARRMIIYSDNPSAGQNRYRAFFNGNELVTAYVNTNTWLHFSMVKRAGLDTGVLYFNGNLIGSTAIGNLTYNNLNAIGLLAPVDNINAGVNGNGIIDQFTAIEAERSANWISAEYANQNNVGTFWGTVTDVGGTTIVNVPRSLRYTVRRPLSVTRSLIYRIIRPTAPLTRALTYRVRRAISITRGLTYRIVAKAIPTRSLQYTIRRAVSIARGLTYRVRSTISAITRSLRYTIQAKIATTRSLRYVVHSEIGLARGLNYRIIRPLAIVRSLGYRIFRPIAIARSLRYGIRRTIIATRGLVYRVVRPTSLTRAINYRIRRAVAIARSLRYVVRINIALTRSQRYTIRRAVLTTRALRYVISSEMALTRTARYAVRQVIAVNRSLTYYITRASALNRGLRYALQLSIGQTKTLQYVISLGGQTTYIITRIFSYCIVTATALSKAVRYSILTQYRVQIALRYIITIAGSLERSMRYVVRRTHIIALQLRYEAVQRSSLAKSMRYHIIFWYDPFMPVSPAPILGAISPITNAPSPFDKTEYITNSQSPFGKPPKRP